MGYVNMSIYIPEIKNKNSNKRINKNSLSFALHLRVDCTYLASQMWCYGGNMVIK